MRATTLFAQRCVLGFILLVSGLLNSASAQLSPPASGAVAAGADFTVALKASGTVWTWGFNDSGQLGDGSTTSRVSPVQVTSITGVARISAGWAHVLSVKTDGTVWGWGNNGSGRLGNGTTTQSLVPVRAGSLTGVIGVAAGQEHSLAVKIDGTVWAWGDNYNGQLGDGTTTTRTSPIQVSGLSDIVAVAAGRSHSLALKSDGTVWAWGYNYYGQLGDGTTTQRLTPVQVTALAGVVVTQIAAGELYSIVIKADGTLCAWGRNSSGQLGNGTTTTALSPIPLTDQNLTNIVAVAAGRTHDLSGRSHTVAIRSDGTAWAWGNNNYQQICDDTVTRRLSPIQIPNVTGAIAVTLGYSHSILLKADGSLVALGSNAYGALGDGSADSKGSSFPVQKFPWLNAMHASAGENHQIVITTDGTAWVWGRDNSYQPYPYQNNNAPIFYDNTLTTFPSFSGGVSSAVGRSHSLLLKYDGTVWAFGENSYRKLGDGTTNRRTTPVVLSTLSNITSIAAGTDYSLALRVDGTVWTWGANYNGQIGDGTTSTPTLPKQVATLSGIMAISSGNCHALALKNDGTVWAWGHNLFGQLGDGTTTQRNTPVEITNLAGVTAIQAGSYRSFALKNDGTVWAWGDNASGELGDGTITQRNTPVIITGLVGTEITSLSAGPYHTLALKSDGNLMAWGSNVAGQLGDGTKIQRTSPVTVLNLSGVTAIKASYGKSVALKADGTFRTWGGVAYLPTPSRTISAIVLKVNPADTDADGLSDAWETTYFGVLTQTALADPDFDGLNNIQEYAVGSNPNLKDADQDRLTDLVDTVYPNDFYNGVTPLITILGGNNQTTLPNQFNANPLDVAVWDPTGTTPYVNAPVTFEVLSGGGQLATTNVGNPSLVTILSVSTDIDGSAMAHYQQPTTANVVSQIRASASTAQVTFTSTSQSGGDTTPPAAPGNLEATAYTLTGFTLGWGASTDNVAVTGYDILKDDVVVASTDAATRNHVFTGLAAATTYRFKVKAKDAAGNISAPSSPLDVTMPNYTVTLDDDGDGIPSVYELNQGLNPFSAGDAAGDIDNDLVDNVTEYLQGRSLTKGAVSDSTGDVALRLFSPKQ